MATLSSGSTVTFPIQPDQTVTITTSPGTEGFVALNAGVGTVTDLIGPMALTAKVLGPFKGGGSLTITSKSGSITYTLSTSIMPGVLSQTAIPIILAPNGTIATNGTVTLGTALPTIYANAWVYFPANAVVGGLAGLYYTTFSSTTVGVVTTSFNAASSAFTPNIPATTVVATGSNSAYTQTTASDLTLVNVTVPGGAMGANGAIRYAPIFSTINNANNKIAKVIFGAITSSQTATTIAIINNSAATIRNRGIQNSQIYTSLTGGTIAYATVNTATDQSLTITGQLATATDYLVIEGYTVEILPAI